ncbi:unnamed protein product [Absidia cylindrospora]
MVQERKEIAARYFLWKLYHVEQKTQEMDAQVNNNRVAANDATEEQLELEEKFKSVRKEQALIHRERTRRELQIKKTKRALTEQRPTLIAIQEKLDHLEKRISQIKQNGTRAERDLEQQKHEVAQLEKSMELLDTEESNYKDEVAQTNYDQGPKLTPEQMATYEQLKQAVSQRATKEQEQLSNLEQKRKLTVQEVDRQTSKLQQLQDSSALYKDERQEVMDNGNALTNDAETLTKQLAARRHDLLSLEQQRKDIHSREVQLNEQLQETLNELMEAKMVQRESEKDSKLKGSLTMMRQLFPGVHGPLAKLCKPTQRKYGQAVSTILGRNLEAIVVDDQQTAIDCIQYLREQRAGKATFLPLTSLSTPAINDRFRTLPRSSLAVDVIKCDHAYLSAVQYACGNTVVCENLAGAKHICYQLNHDVKAVTLDGNVIHRSGLITGGPSSSQKDKIWDEKDVDGLLRTRDKILAELNELSRNKRMGSAEEQAKCDCDGMESRLSFVQDEIKIAEQKLKDVDSSLQHIQENMVIHQQQLVHAQHSLGLLDNDIQQIKQHLSVVEDDIFGDFCGSIGVSTIRQYEELQFTLPDQVREQHAKYNTQRTRLQTQHSFEKEQLGSIRERLTTLITSLHKAEQAQQGYQAELVALEEQKETWTNDGRTYEAELQVQLESEHAKQQEMDAIRLTLEEKGKDMDAYLKEITVVENNIDKMRAERAAIFRKCKLEEIYLPLLSGTMDDVLIDDTAVPSSLGTRGSENSMDVDELTQRSIRSTDWTVEVDFSPLDEDERNDGSDELEKRYQDDIKHRDEDIDRMEPNLKAIDRLDGVEQRLEEIEQEYRTARKSVDTAKEKFDQVIRQRSSLFRAAFTHVAEHIDQVYKELTITPTFPLGGTAYLTLEDTDESYTKGVMYHVMPPMKRFLDMAQLSGGEKSMAALALLFAIRSYQPSPFFVLDEVDAALDNANVKKVARYIRRQANDSFQFIVISFKNILYERAESLVGIYRDMDYNSSKSLTLKLDEYEEVA